LIRKTLIKKKLKRLKIEKVILLDAVISKSNNDNNDDINQLED